MDNDLKRKHNLMIKLEKYERALIELNKWSPGDEISASTKELTGEVSDVESKDKWVTMLEEVCQIVKKDKVNTNGKLYLSEIIEKEKPKFTSNNLILSPTGSGKSHFMKTLMEDDEVLMLVSTTSLKDKLVPKSKSERMALGNRMYSTDRSEIYGEGDCKILVMTYAQFGREIKFTDDFANKYTKIFCDEIHSLFDYYTIDYVDTLLVAIRYLFAIRDNQIKFYFTATDEYIEKFKKIGGKLFDNVSVFDYLKHPHIVRHMVLSSYKINRLEQVKPHLKARQDSFNYFGYKAFAFCKTIESLKTLEDIMLAEGFNPLVLWSINNKEKPLNDEQIKQRAFVLRTGLIPDEYDSLIINSSMQEGWDLLDPKVKLVIMNTTNETEYVQAIGRVRQDVDVLIYRINSGIPDYYVDFPTELLDVPLTTKMKNVLTEEFGLNNENGRPLKWPSIKTILQSQDYIIDDKVVSIDRKPTRVSIVSYPAVDDSI